MGAIAVVKLLSSRKLPTRLLPRLLLLKKCLSYGIRGMKYPWLRAAICTWMNCCRMFPRIPLYLANRWTARIYSTFSTPAAVLVSQRELYTCMAAMQLAVMLLLNLCLISNPVTFSGVLPTSVG